MSLPKTLHLVWATHTIYNGEHSEDATRTAQQLQQTVKSY